LVLSKFMDIVLALIFLILIILAVFPGVRTGVGNILQVASQSLGFELELPKWLQGKDSAGGSCTDIASCKLLVKTATPSLSAAQVNSLLAEKNSPATGTGSVFESESSRTGIDDAIALAFFWQESNFGTAGVAVHTKSMGNIKYTNPQDCLGGSYKNPKDGALFCVYSNWEAGIRSWYDRIDKYYIAEGRDTLGSIISKYAPCSENNVQQYVANVIEFVKDYRDVSSCPV